METISLIYSADISFQVLFVLPNVNLDAAWIVANQLAGKLAFQEINVEHYDVVSFENVDKMNEWILEQVSLSRE